MMNNSAPQRGKLISFEGLDGAGKTTQIELLTHWLDVRQVRYMRTREPGGTSLGSEIRRLLLERPELEITPLAEAFLFQADRAQHFHTLVLPALEVGTLVITDRCLDASIAYQGFARNVGPELVTQLSVIATQGHLPDLTILLDLDPGEVQQRTDPANDQSGLREAPSRFDSEAAIFHYRVRQGFRLIARAHPTRVQVVDAGHAVEEVHQAIVQLVEPLL
ncbi:MAG: dTMP kinase [Ktedonobacteraceae bacterium]